MIHTITHTYTHAPHTPPSQQKNSTSTTLSPPPNQPPNHHKVSQITSSKIDKHILTTNPIIVKNTNKNGRVVKNTNKKKGLSLKLLTINVRGVKSKLTSLHATLHTHGTHIAGLTETLLNTGEQVTIDGYTTHTKNRTIEGGGIALVIRNDVASMIDIIEDNRETNPTDPDILWAKTKSKPEIYIGI